MLEIVMLHVSACILVLLKNSWPEMLFDVGDDDGGHIFCIGDEKISYKAAPSEWGVGALSFITL